MSARRYSLAFALLFTLVSAFPLAGIGLAATPPALINYQGVLRNASNSPLSGNLDMVFHFYDAAAGGNQILMDHHTLFTGGQVAVSGGLFNVTLGGGTVYDGAGPGFYASLANVFRDYGAIYLEIQVAAETLSPRLRVTSSAYALNASNLGGREPGEFLDTSSTSQTKTSSLYLISSDQNLPGITAQGAVGGGYFTSSDYSGFAYAGLPGEGINAHGLFYGGRFYNTDTNGATVTLATNSLAISAVSSGVGSTYTGFFRNLTTQGDVYLGSPYVSVFGTSPSNNGGVQGRSASGLGVIGESDSGYGVAGQSESGIGGVFGVAATSAYANVGFSTYKIQGTGAVSFVQNHPVDADRVIVYNSLEGDEVGTYTRGTARLADGEARIALGETFKWVTNPDIGLTAQLTPHGEAVPLAVVSLSPEELIVRGPSQGPKDLVFDYTVQGLRIGFEEVGIVQEKRRESFIPSMVDHRKSYAEHPELRPFNALERFKAAATAVTGDRAVDLSRAAALKEAIHEYNTAVDGPAMRLKGWQIGPNQGLVPSVTAMSPLGPDATASAAAVGDRASVSLSGAPGTAASITPSGRSDAGALSATSPDGPDADARGMDGMAARAQAEPSRGELTAATWESGRDGATWMPVAESVEQGDVLIAEADGDDGGSLRLSAASADPAVVGIATKASSGALAPVATSGVAWCKVDAGTAPIRPGDLLTASSTPGRAMKAQTVVPGTILGKALERLDVGVGLIRIVITLR